MRIKDLKLGLITVALMLLNGLDAYLTIPHFAWELNPLAVTMGMHPFMVLKLTLVPIITFLLFWWGLKRPWIRIVLYIFTILYVCVVIWNLSTYLIHV